MRSRRWRPTSRETREATQYLLGVVIVLHELFVHDGPERPTMILAGCGLITGTFIFGAARNGNTKRGE